MLATQATPDVSDQILERLAVARRRSDELFELLPEASLYDRPIAERHRVIFYVGHLEAFDWNLLRERALDLKPFHPEFDHLFAFGIDPVGGGLPSDQPANWPSVAEVRRYVARIRESIDGSLEAALSSPAMPDVRREFPLDLLLNIAIEHRLMHAETLAYMLHQFPLGRKRHRSPESDLAVSVSVPVMIDIPEGSATLGISHNDTASFGWDNEYKSERVYVPAYAIDKYEVTNRQYLDFIAAGGYDNSEYWREADWKWKTKNKVAHPIFWRRRANAWLYRTMFDERPLPLEWPVYVSHAEANAYARWAGKSLPTEAQWHRAAYGTPDGSERAFPWGSDPPCAELGNFDFQRWNPTPVAAFLQGDSAFGVSDLLGNGWEWTSTVFAPFRGFEPFPFYAGYSANFFDGQHYVMKGGSARTAASMLRRSFRNWFQPHYQYVYAGFRCVSS